MRYFVFADPHGDFNALTCALIEAGYDMKNKDHQLVGLGDYFGRASQSVSDCLNIWEYLRNNAHANKPICIRGNHESILIDAIKRRTLTNTDITNGEHNTFASFVNCYPNQMAYDPWYQFDAAKMMCDNGFLDWLENLPWYYETNNYIFTHGFIPVNYFLEGSSLDSFDDDQWNIASWCMTPKVIKELEDHECVNRDKTIVFGHWTSSDLVNKFVTPCDYYGQMFKYKNYIGLDYTTVITHKVGCIVVND